MNYNIIIAWVAVSAVIVVIDFAAIIAFGIDYNNLKVRQPEYTRRYTD